MTEDPPREPPLPCQPTDRPEMAPCVRSEELLQGGRELLIAHGQELYRLRLTRSGKLILGK